MNGQIRVNTIEEVGEGAKLTLEGFLFFVFLFFFLVRW